MEELHLSLSHSPPSPPPHQGTENKVTAKVISWNTWWPPFCPRFFANQPAPTKPNEASETKLTSAALEQTQRSATCTGTFQAFMQNDAGPWHRNWQGSIFTLRFSAWRNARLSCIFIGPAFLLYKMHMIIVGLNLTAVKCLKTLFSQ